jgi:hypothetical protein
MGDGESLVSDIPAGDGKIVNLFNLFYSVFFKDFQISLRYMYLYTVSKGSTFFLLQFTDIYLNGFLILQFIVKLTVFLSLRFF